MSRIGRLPISIPSGVEVKIDGQDVTVKGPKGELALTVAVPIEAKVEEGQILVTRPDDERNSRSLHGLTRTLIANNIVGVTQGYTKSLLVVGTGYRAKTVGKDVELALGYSHAITFEAPDGITLTVDEASLPGASTKVARVNVSGIDKHAVGEVAAQIRKLRKPEPYKGKGVRYEGENVRRKAGKSGKK